MVVTVLGLGNILCGDEGLGVRLAERLYADYDFTPHINLVDGGTQGLPLLQYVESASKLLLLDAVDFGLAPGELLVHHGEMPAYITAKKLSAHQSSFAEVLAMAQFRGNYPEQVVLVGMQPVSLAYGEGLSPTAREALPKLLAHSVEVLRQFGVTTSPASEQRRLNASCLEEA